MSELDLTIVRVIPAARKAVFEAWLDPKALSRFMTPGPGMSVPEASSDAREGGQFRIVMKMGEKELPHTGEYKTVDRYETLAFTWNSIHSHNTLVTLTFVELSPNETELTLHHEGFPNEEMRNNHQGGWTAIVEQLARVLG